MQDLPGSPLVKNPLSNAGDMGSIPGQGTEIPHSIGQLTPRPATRVTETMLSWARMPQLAYLFMAEAAINKYT